MVSLTKTSISISKKDLLRGRSQHTSYRNTVFYHKAAKGSYSINLLSLTMPSAEMPSAIQATPEELSGARLSTIKNNLTLVSSSKGNLIQNLDFYIVDSYTIQLMGMYADSGTEANEIFVGTIANSPVGDLVVASSRNITKTYTLPIGATSLALGNEFIVGANINESVGSIKVYLDGQLKLRNSGNSSVNLDRDYFEVDSGDGTGVMITFNTSYGAAKRVVVDFGVQAITDFNAIGTMESYGGAIKKLADDLAMVVGGSSTDYTSANPSQAERRMFGDMVLSHDSHLSVHDAQILNHENRIVTLEAGGGTGSGVGGVDIMHVESADKSVLTDFTQVGLSISSTPVVLHGTKTLRVDHDSVVDNYFKRVVAVDRKFRGKITSFSLDVVSTASTAYVLFRDETNSADIGVSQLITTGSQSITATTNTLSDQLTGMDNATVNSLKVGMVVSGSNIPTGTTITAIDTVNKSATMSQLATAASTGIRISDLATKRKLSVTIPANCSSISYKITCTAQANAVSSYFDDIVWELAEFAKTSYSLSQTTFNNTPWTAYTPTISAGFGTVTNNVAEWRQIGELIEVRGSFTAGSVAASVGSISLPSSYIVDTTKLTISSNTVTQPGTAIGQIYQNAQSGAFLPIVTCPGTSTSLVYAGGRTSSTSMLVPENVTTFASSNQVFSYSFSFPAVGVTASTTTTNSIPLSSSVLVTEPDSVFRGVGFLGTGSTNTGVVRLGTVKISTGDALTYISDSVNGDRWLVNRAGMYSMYSSNDISGANTVQQYFTRNATLFTAGNDAGTHAAGVVVSSVGYINSNTDAGVSASGTAYFDVGDIIRFHSTNASGPTLNNFYDVVQITYQGKLKILNPSVDQKVDIPTHYVAFSNQTGNGSINTGVVKYANTVSVLGDGLQGFNDAAYGTYVLVKKAGIASVSGQATVGANGNFYLTKNASVLTTSGPLSTETLAFVEGENANAQGLGISWTGPVSVGDILRVQTGSSTTGALSNFSVLLQEQSVAVALQNVAPRWDNSDSYVQLRTGNGYGSSATKIKRFSNIVQNFGSDITYVDDASNGASFTINTSGIYNISFSDFGSANDYIGVTKNQTNLTQTTDAVPSSELLTHSVTAGANYSSNVSWSGYLIKGDVIRANGSAATSTNGTLDAKFSISRVGKTSGTVDVTPFVQIPQNDVEAIEALTSTSTFGSTNTGVPVLNITKNTNKGIIQVISDSVSGTSFKVLKDCDLKISASGSSGNSDNLLITRNETVLTAGGSPLSILASNGVNGALGVTSVFSVESNISAIVGDIIRIQRKTGNIASITQVTLTATAISSSVATPTQSVSSDTMNFVWSGTALTGNEAVGTFNTYTYLANNNNPTISTSAPSQSASDMNVNGIKVFAKSYTAASTAASPARVDIMVGKGLKSVDLRLYGLSGKSNAQPFDLVAFSSNVTGTRTWYSEVTGVLTIDCANDPLGTAGQRYVDSSYNFTSGYFVFNASKSPSLVTIPTVMAVAASYWVPANFAASTTIPINFSSLEHDTHGAVTVSATAWKFTCPVTGYYQIAIKQNISTAVTVITSIYKNGVIYKPIGYSASGAYTFGNSVIKLNAGDYIDFRPDSSITYVGGALSSSNTSITITKIGG